MKYLIVSEKSWNKGLVNALQSKFSHEFILISKREDFNYANVMEMNPTKIFVPHWSYIIPEVIFDNFETIVFHMTDLPFGRGGSPLQNLIIRGFMETKISALKVVKEMDAGDIYLKKDLQLAGTAQEIFESANSIIETMIVEIIEKNLLPEPQFGKPVLFTRRKPSDGNISELENVEKVYDYIRMLDAEGYPNAFLETEFFKFEFVNANLQNENQLIANVRITKK